MLAARILISNQIIFYKFVNFAIAVHDWTLLYVTESIWHHTLWYFQYSNLLVSSKL